MLMLVCLGIEVVALVVLTGLVIRHAAGSAPWREGHLHKLWAVLVPQALAGDRRAQAKLAATVQSERRLDLLAAFLRAEPETTGADTITQVHFPRTASLSVISDQLGLTDLLRQRLRTARRDLERATAASLLVSLGRSPTSDEIAPLLESKDPVAVLVAARALARIGSPDMVLPVFEAIYRRTPITLHGAAGMLVEFGPGACPRLVSLLQEVLDTPREERDGLGLANEAAQVVLIDLLAFFQHKPAARVLRDLLTQAEDTEVVIHLIKALGALGDEQADTVLAGFLRHENWVVRSQAAKALAQLESDGWTEVVEPLAIDPDPRVRSLVQQILASRDAQPGRELDALGAALV